MNADLLLATAELVDIPSQSYSEAVLADHVESCLRAVRWLEVDRIANNVVARTPGDGPRVLLAGHLDTVPANYNATARIDSDVLWGLGAADMKGGLAVMLELARSLEKPVRPLSFIFYAAEEVARADNGLLEIERVKPEVLEAQVAILGEPTGAMIEAGCQGVIKARVVLGGVRAHTARPWMGVNALHRLAAVLACLRDLGERRPLIDGCEYRESVSVVSVEGGVAGNVVPDRATLTLSFRFAPDRTSDSAEAWLRDQLCPYLDATLGDTIEVVDKAPAASPGLGHPVLASLLAATGKPPRAKLGWTDVAFFSERGIPAVNFGPGDPELAHTRDERVERSQLETVYANLEQVLSAG